jgi:hypothetical protein
MQNNFLRRLVEFAVDQPSQVMAVIVIFIVGFALVGIPAHFRSGPTARDVWGTVAGVTLSLLYLILIFSAKPSIHH